LGYERRLADGQRVVIAVHALLECFSVLTRMPSPFRTAPETAERALATYFRDGAEICGLDPEDCWSAITELARYGRGGGRIYDAVIALSTYRAGASLLLTWNVRDFLLVAPPGLEVREP
jgi:predicted nucleic acid-binding protein